MRRGERIGSFDDRTSDDEIVGAGSDGLRGRRHAFLIAVRAAGRTNPRREREEVVAEETLEVADLVRAADDAGSSPRRALERPNESRFRPVRRAGRAR